MSLFSLTWLGLDRLILVGQDNARSRKHWTALARRPGSCAHTTKYVNNLKTDREILFILSQVETPRDPKSLCQFVIVNDMCFGESQSQPSLSTIRTWLAGIFAIVPIYNLLHVCAAAL